jgi:hypothetical protein
VRIVRVGDIAVSSLTIIPKDAHAIVARTNLENLADRPINNVKDSVANPQVLKLSLVHLDPL